MDLDRRLYAFRPDLAEKALEGKIDAARFVSGETASIALAVADLRSKPNLQAGIDTQLLMGEPVTVFERRAGWAWVKSDIDSYVGYLPLETLCEPKEAPTHWITAARTFLYPQAELKTRPVAALSMGSRLHFVDETELRGTRYLIRENGEAVIAAHCAPLNQRNNTDYVTVAAKFIETPYLWGGRSGFGIDCSGLVQLSMMMADMRAPRDSDMQEKGLGAEISGDDLMRGDLVFWRGHVGIMETPETMIHANGHTMTVARETLAGAIQRIGYLYGQPTRFRRPS